MSLFYQRLDETGDGSGNDNMNIDGSSAPIIFKIKPGIDESLKIARIIVYVEDSGTFDAEKWGNGITMSNGIEFKLKQNGIPVNKLGFNIKSSGDMAGICHDLNHQAFGTGNEFVTFRLTFTKAGRYVRLSGAEGDEMQCIINDDLSGLVKMHIIAQGFYA